LSFSQTSSLPGWWSYNCGLINTALGRAADAEAEFRSAILMPDNLLSYHFTRLALAHHSPGGACGVRATKCYWYIAPLQEHLDEGLA